MIDLHSHVLPGIDDGPATIEDSLAFARVAAADGTRILLATPHVSWEYPNRSADIGRLVGGLNRRLAAEGVPLEVRGGAELAMTRIGDLEAHELERLGLGGGPWLLVEPPFTPVVTGLDALVSDLQQRGHRVLLAHPERCIAFHRDRSMLERMVGGGVATSITAGSLDGRFGATARRFALDMFADHLVHNVASDAHDPTHRAPTIAGELARAGLGALASWLTEEVPAAILEGGDIPPRPPFEPAPRRRWLGLGRRGRSGGPAR